ncbi:major facilitator superfamily domain-containing protein [Aspergillus granulosus]|uniref:Lysosomal dipeptide transporter MFSD1 n=1 Tax=Aspergillus granulosus TaxID=176169 RepID=A0ABR4H450_9EURO
MTHWRVLAAVGMMNWGTYFSMLHVYDIPASLSTPLSEHLSFSDHQTAYLVSLLYAVYSIPNTILPFFTGTAVQRFGERSLLLGIMSTITLGQVLFALGVQTRIEFGMVVGRALIGLGGEVVGVLGCEIITRWFQHKRLSLALAINLGLGRLGSVSNSIIVPCLIEPYGVVAVAWIATVMSLGVSIVGLVSLLALPDPATESDMTPLISENPHTALKSKPFSPASSIRHFPRVFWHLALICLLSYGCVNTFTNSAQRLLALRFYDGNQPAAGGAITILFILSGLLVAPFGFLLDMLRSRGYPRALTTSNVLLILAHGIFWTDSISTPIIPLCLIGTADALLGVAFWGSVMRCLLSAASPNHAHSHAQSCPDRDPGFKDGLVPLMSEELDITPLSNGEEADGSSILPIHGEAVRTLGIGIMTSLTNISTAVVPVFLAVVENAAGFTGLEVVFLILGVLSCMVCVRLAWAWELESNRIGNGDEDSSL